MPSSRPDPAERERRRRAAELLGDLMPSTTSDETDEGWSELGGTSRDEDYLRDVPPHHG
ncbi:MAG: hypothetical protein JWQ91_636 [Aeromicrobium sp.]|jgi:hypothetical protein|uniref:hypothetical protein n=1 Tax=Aeromicrobium sp. TaxID=1871063 RepID=UPI00262C69D7|nr:hypothetical protein [Aeromicrobium sp.]MCW2788894.1 hypothetical protein [Aeromicrobium sp.]MCW2823719.1 hypothetical protein [Aeromicrobium sp.]